MKHKTLVIANISILLCMASSIYATIVWEGETLNEWPAEAFPERQHSHKVLTKVTSTTTGLGIYASPKGVYTGLTLLVDFSDNPAVFTKQEVWNWLNQPGFNVNNCDGSIRDYYLDVSNEQFDYKNDVFGYYRAKHTKAWYEDLNSGINYVGSDSLLNEVLTFFDDSVDYRHYDFEGDSYADAINIVYVGTPKAWAKGLWPHAGHVGQVKDSILLVRYEMTNLASTFSLGTFVHESGHMIFGWPDLYYFGDYCAMGSGTANSPKAPVSPNDFFRADQGWIPLNDVSSTIFSAETTNSSNGYIFKNPSNSDEGYFWSYVKGGWKRWSYLSGSMGLLVFHYNLAEQGNSSPEHLRLRVIEADGGNELLASMVPEPGHAYDLFNEYTQSILINPLWYDNTESGLRITQIGNPAGTITFTMEGSGSSSSSTTISSSSGTTMILKNEAMGASNFDHRSERFDLLGRNNQQRQD